MDNTENNKAGCSKQLESSDDKEIPNNYQNQCKNKKTNIVTKKVTEGEVYSETNIQENKFDDNTTPVKKRRMEFDFWTKSEHNNKNINSKEVDDEECLKIENLVIGKFIQKLLKIRITYKSQLRETRVGTIFTFHGMDGSSEIAFINFGKETILLWKEIAINCMYCIKNFSVDAENDSYPSGSGNQFQIKLNPNTIIKHLNEDGTIPQIKFNFVPLDTFQSLKINDKVDVLGILVEDYGIETTSKGSAMRDLALTDTTKGNIVVTLWASEAENFVCEKFSVIAIRKANVIEFAGKKKLNCLSGTLVWVMF